ncbi:hypothetical protein CY0110_15702 [Crocosphaera chwakensis CCY0110]|uniref:Uncharacterized protein n=1 Tax=Crocosphaera chwakensis CCY0110 TaxID=391612 RepID=A3IHH2_9CHRO|nr:hypothetical protein CY0110_15702 [Crocosphaera chwakensis CCY0110]
MIMFIFVFKINFYPTVHGCSYIRLHNCSFINE